MKTYTELSLIINLFSNIDYSLAGEYTYTYNKDEYTPLSFSPPASMRNTLTWKSRKFQFYGEIYSIASQHRVAKNEANTPGVNLINFGGNYNLKLGKAEIDVNLSFRNILDTCYYNHLSFYRKVEIPEPGRNIQLLIRIPFKTILK